MVPLYEVRLICGEWQLVFAWRSSVDAVITMGDDLLRQVRETSSDLWRGVGARLGLRLILLALAAGLWTTAPAWLANGGAADPLPGASTRSGIALLSIIVLLGGLTLAFLDSLRAVVVEGPLLRSLGDLILGNEGQPYGPRLEDHFAAFASPQRLSRLTRIRDLPLVLFLVHMVLSQDVKPLLRLSATGTGREGLIRRLEGQVRKQAAATLSRLRVVLLSLFVAAISIPDLAAWLLR